MPKKDLDLEQIRDHWKNWATTFGTDLRATTKTSTAKQVEIFALLKTVEFLKASLPKRSKILEIGCGNGYNLLSLYKAFPEHFYEGIDFIEEMISSAEKNQQENNIPSESLKFSVGNVLKLDSQSNDYDLIFTIRCLINLNSSELQLDAIKNISNRIKKGGHLLMLENSKNSYDKQNTLRHLVGLEKRTPAEFNHFFEDEALIAKLPGLGLKEIKNENFTTLHDLVLYILVPLINGGIVDYKHPIVEAAAKLSMAISESGNSSFGDYGQNRLYLFQKL